MIHWAVSGLNLGNAELVITILKEHEEKFQVSAGIAKLFGGRARLVVLETPTGSQSETVAKTLDQLQYDGPFLIKDSDNTFEIGTLQRDYNYVCVDSLNNFDEINPRNKSYVASDHTGLINNIREKSVISDTFSVGGYFFRSAQVFLDAYAALRNQPESPKREIYVSDIIGHLLVRGVSFYAEKVNHYHDWGTIHEWRKFLHDNAAVFVALDGFVFERGYRYFEPKFENVKPHAGVLQALIKLAADGNSIVYLSVRDAAESEITHRQIREAGLPEGTIVFGCPSARWKFLTAPHPVLPFATFAALELSPDDPEICEKIASV